MMATVWLICVTIFFMSKSAAVSGQEEEDSYCVMYDVDTEVGDKSDYCVVSGDPHIKTFDSLKFDHQGECSYTLVNNCEKQIYSKGLYINFTVVGEFHHTKHHRRVSVMKKLIYRTENQYKENLAVVVDTEDFNVSTIEPYVQKSRTYTKDNGVISHSLKKKPKELLIYQYCNAMVLHDYHTGIKLILTRPHRVYIYSGEYGRDTDEQTLQLCGLCGNGNGFKFDDLTTRDANLVSDVEAFGHSWRTEETCEACQDCKKKTLCQTNRHNAKKAGKMCSFFQGVDIQLESGKLHVNLPTCSGVEWQEWYISCLSIVCGSYPETGGFCKVVSDYEAACEESNVGLHGLPRPSECPIAPRTYRNE